MFTAKFKESNTFKRLIDSIKEIVKLVNVDVNHEGMFIQAMDSSHVALVAVSLENGNEAFEEYRCDKPVTLGLSIESLSKILKCAGNQDFMRIECDCDSASQLHFKFSSKNSDQLGVPEQTYTATVEMDSAEFARICKEFGTLSETIKIQCTKDAIRFAVLGDVGSGNTTLRQSEAEQGVSLSVDEPVSLSFSARYLNQFSKASMFVEKVRLHMSAENPLLIEYDLPKKLGHLRFYLAPKISDEEA